MEAHLVPSYRFTGRFVVNTPSVDAFSQFATDVFGFSSATAGALQMESLEISLHPGLPSQGMIPVFASDDFELSKAQFDRLAYPSVIVNAAAFIVQCPGGVLIQVEKG